MTDEQVQRAIAEMSEERLNAFEMEDLHGLLTVMLERELPDFGDIVPEALNFRDYLKSGQGGPGLGALEAKGLTRLAKACRMGHPTKPNLKMGPGQVDVQAAELLSLIAQLCLGIEAAHTGARPELAEDDALVRWALREWAAQERGARGK